MRFAAGLLTILLVVLPCTRAAAADPVPSRVRLQSPQLVVEVSPRLGGRMLHLSLPGEPNLLLAGEAVESQPDPRVDAAGENIPYLGHEVWVGPQAAWWLDQTLNPARREAAAQWPPDPWLAHAPAQVLAQDRDRLVLQGAASPVSGVQLTKTFSIAADRPGTAELAVEMRNIRKVPVGHDIWFNSRVPPETRVFVPVARDGSGVRVRADTGDGFDGLSQQQRRRAVLAGTAAPVRGPAGATRQGIHPAARRLDRRVQGRPGVPDPFPARTAGADPSRPK